MVWNKKKKDEADEDYKQLSEPTKQEVADLRLKLSKYTQIRINGRLQRRFDQYCKTNGVIYFDEYGQVVVTDPTEYARLNKINDKVETRERFEQELYLKTHPEEAEKMREQFKVLDREMRSKFGIKI